MAKVREEKYEMEDMQEDIKGLEEDTYELKEMMDDTWKQIREMKRQLLGCLQKTSKRRMTRR
eukprot:10624798-Karenia_brevis.AAC.1